MFSKTSNTSFLIDGIVNNNYCDHIHVTVDDEDCCHASSHPNLYSSRRPEVAAAPLSLRSLNYASDTDLEETVQDARTSDRNVALLNSSLGRKGIRTKVPLLKTLDAEHILSWIEDMAAYAITKEDSDNSLLLKALLRQPDTVKTPFSECRAFLPSDVQQGQVWGHIHSNVGQI
ncbi:hypothetical protein GEMRC1_002602 [Eukaryota sp. GEM-RC1]